MEWTVSIRNDEATAASQKLGGKVSAYIRKLETVLKGLWLKEPSIRCPEQVETGATP